MIFPAPDIIRSFFMRRFYVTGGNLRSTNAAGGAIIAYIYYQSAFKEGLMMKNYTFRYGDGTFFSSSGI